MSSLSSEILSAKCFIRAGYIDFVVKVSGGSATTIINVYEKNTPEVKLLGHLTVPTRLTAAKGT